MSNLVKKVLGIGALLMGIASVGTGGVRLVTREPFSRVATAGIKEAPHFDYEESSKKRAEGLDEKMLDCPLLRTTVEYIAFPNHGLKAYYRCTFMIACSLGEKMSLIDMDCDGTTDVLTTDVLNPHDSLRSIYNTTTAKKYTGKGIWEKSDQKLQIFYKGELVLTPPSKFPLSTSSK